MVGSVVSLFKEMHMLNSCAYPERVFQTRTGRGINKVVLGTHV